MLNERQDKWLTFLPFISFFGYDLSVIRGLSAFISKRAY